jgi:hypothetical protein
MTKKLKLAYFVEILKDVADVSTTNNKQSSPIASFKIGTNAR